MSKAIDYIIVGAGSSGCVLAAELSRDPDNQVLLIESGPADTSFLLKMPRGIGKVLAPGNPYVWSYDIHRPGERKTENWLKGRGLGGSSSVNGMVYSRGFAHDYDLWANKYGCAGWRWDEVLPEFKAIEDHGFGESDMRGVGGPLRITGHQEKGAGEDVFGLCEAVLNALDQAGTPRVKDNNAAPDGGAGYQCRNIYDGRRQSAAVAFLHPAMSRSNLQVMTDTQVNRVVFEGKKAVGVEVQDKNGIRIIRTNKEVILSAGAIESPKLLQLSGIGPAEKLQPLGIDVVHDQSAVGQNLREHFNLQVRYRVKSGSLNSAFQGVSLFGNLFRYLFTRKGPMSHAAQEMIAYIKTREGLPFPDAQIGIGLYSLVKGPKGPILDKEPGISFCGYHVHPQSQGELYITSADPREPPYIKANYLQDPEDQAASLALIRYIRQVVAQPALAPFIVDEIAPGNTVQSDEDILQAFLKEGDTSYHIIGTCRMGSDPDAVVDPQARVNGVENLRVVDTSIFPELITGNTNAPAMMAGRKVAGMMMQSR